MEHTGEYTAGRYRVVERIEKAPDGYHWRVTANNDETARGFHWWARQESNPRPPRCKLEARFHALPCLFRKFPDFQGSAASFLFAYHSHPCSFTSIGVAAE